MRRAVRTSISAKPPRPRLCTVRGSRTMDDRTPCSARSSTARALRPAHPQGPFGRRRVGLGRGPTGDGGGPRGDDERPAAVGERLTDGGHHAALLRRGGVEGAEVVTEGEVDDPLGQLGGLADDVEVVEGTADDRGPGGGDRRGRGIRAGERGHRVTGGEEFGQDHGPDRPGGTREEDLHGNTPIVMRLLSHHYTRDGTRVPSPSMSAMARWEPDARERLVLAALDLFTEQGYDATTVAQIAERAGLTKSTFFRHFPDKRELLVAGQETLSRLLAEGIREAPPGHLTARRGRPGPRTRLRGDDAVQPRDRPTAQGRGGGQHRTPGARRPQERGHGRGDDRGPHAAWNPRSHRPPGGRTRRPRVQARLRPMDGHRRETRASWAPIPWPRSSNSGPPRPGWAESGPSGRR